MFPRLTLIGGGFGGPPSFPLNTANGAPAPHPEFTNAELDAAYAKLDPPRRYYQDYWASPEADRDMKHVPQGMTDFFRAFCYMKSADFPGNQNCSLCIRCIPPRKPPNSMHKSRNIT